MSIRRENVGIAVSDLDAAAGKESGYVCHLLRGVAKHRDVYRLTCLRGPDGILVMLAEELRS